MPIETSYSPHTSNIGRGPVFHGQVTVIETISAVARETGNSSNYSDPMDFIVGEGLGIKYREYCQKFYYKNGRPLHKILSKKELAMLDTTLAKHVISVFSPQLKHIRPKQT